MEIMENKINYRDASECMHLIYKDMNGMTKDDAIYILQETIDRYHEAEKQGTNSAMLCLPRARLIRAYEITIEAIKREVD
jgi:hypothetical protein